MKAGNRHFSVYFVQKSKWDFYGTKNHIFFPRSNDLVGNLADFLDPAIDHVASLKNKTGITNCKKILHVKVCHDQRLWEEIIRNSR